MASLTTRGVSQLMALSVKSFSGSPEELVQHLRRITRMTPPLGRLPRGVRRHRACVAGVGGEWLTPAAQARGVLLYIHGGAFIAGSPRLYLPFCGQLAKDLGMSVFLPEYRLAPEQRFPAALEDIAAVYTELSEQAVGRDEGFAVLGDSAGGGLALAALQQAGATRGRRADCAVLISPGLDARGMALSLKANADSMLSPGIIRDAIALYLGTHTSTDPRASPILGSFYQLPPLLISVSEDECLRDHAYMAASKGKQAGVPVTLLKRHGMPHIWPVFHKTLPEAKLDYPKIMQFLKSHILRNAPWQPLEYHHEKA